jgi:hypothetical protein
MNLEKLVTVKQLSVFSPAFSEASLRWMIFNAETNGLNRALVKPGRRVLIDVPEFERWLESQRLGEVETEPPDGAK